jgi:pimeloyl-ACP methyl ester carboxylesterase
MGENNRAVLLIGGWADVGKCVENLKTTLTAQFNSVLHFRYAYAKQKFESGVFETMDNLAARLYAYIRDNSLLETDTQFSIIGYSQGGMLALYTLGRYPEICSHVHKIVSIAAPHGGALVDQLRGLVSGVQKGIKDLLLSSNNLFAQITGKLIEATESQLETFGMGDAFSNFIENRYPLVVQEVFERIPKPRILEIYASNDPIARPESCRRFEKSMETFQVDYSDHQSIANFAQVIAKTMEFLND